MSGQGWTIEDAPRLDGRRAVVTGASGGLGFETALGLARRGAHVVLAARNRAKAEAALGRIRAAVPGADLRVLLLDLADLSSVKTVAETLLGEGVAVDLLVNNAGVMAYPTRRTTRDGFEEQFGTNYLGHFTLTGRLIPALLRAAGGARVVSLASLAHVQGRIALDDLQGVRHYDGWTAYRQSKLAMLIFAREFQRRADAAGWPVRSIAAHPGWAVTDIISNGPAEGRGGLKPAMMNLAFRLLGQSAADGALPILYAAMAPEASPGGYYGPAGLGERTGPVGASRVMPQAQDEAMARALWEASERLTGVRFDMVEDDGMTRIAILAAGAMGAGIGLHLTEGGATVLTNLDGRGEDSRRRAAEAGMADVPLDEIARADLILSIVPPGSAVALAERLAPALAASTAKPVFVDANAVSPETVERVRAALDGTGCAVVDGCIIGAPPKARGKSPAFYVSGDPDRLTAPLGRHGLDLKPMDAPFGAASGLKLVYAMCTKGVTALAAGMFLGAERNGAGDALRAELARSQPELVERFGKAMPDMLPKAYRWVAEMREIAAFLGPDDPAALMFEGAARMYERLAADREGSGELGRTLLGVVG